MIFAGLVSACATAPDPVPRVLAADELRATLTATPLTRCGRVLLGGWRYTGVHNSDGTMTGRVLAGRTREDVVGTWQVTGDGLYCRTWSNNWAGGREGCFRVTRSGEDLTFDHVSGSAGEQQSYTYRLGEVCD